jgi:hypothetical protein
MPTFPNLEAQLNGILSEGQVALAMTMPLPGSLLLLSGVAPTTKLALITVSVWLLAEPIRVLVTD